jgi:indolepyruvate decarboxylase
MRLAPYLFQRLFDLGAAHAFGIPGDLALPLYRALGESPISHILTTHEPSAAFAADAYARLKGIGLAVATYGAGALNMVNPVAQAYAEMSPIVVVSGAPDIVDRDPCRMIHHKVKTFATQQRIYEELTVASAVLAEPETAYGEINRVIDAVRSERRPGYLEVPRDMALVEIPVSTARPPFRQASDPDAIAEVMQELTSRLNRSRRPVLLAGVEIMRLGLRKQLIQVSERYHLPVATSFMGKAVFPEHHPNFIGTYMGLAADPYTRRMVDDSDCLIMLGAWLTDTEAGLVPNVFRHEILIQVSASEVAISHHRYGQVGLAEIMAAWLQGNAITQHEFRNEYAPHHVSPGSPSFVEAIFIELSGLDDRHYVFVTDTGDCLFGSVALNAETILNPGYYASMGFAVPGALGAALALPERRVVALVGDGGFQMTGMELGTLVRYGLNAVVIVLNNGGYRSLQALGAPERFCEIHPWNYVGVAEALGAKATRVAGIDEFTSSLRQACERSGVFLIEVLLDPHDVSPALRRLAGGQTPSNGPA